MRRRDHDAVWIGDDFAGIRDPDVLAKAKREGRILVTKDKDFGELAFRGHHAHEGIILLRLADERPANTIRVLEAVMEHPSVQKPPFFIVASDSEFRVRSDE